MGELEVGEGGRGEGGAGELWRSAVGDSKIGQLCSNSKGSHRGGNFLFLVFPLPDAMRTVR